MRLRDWRRNDPVLILIICVVVVVGNAGACRQFGSRRSTTYAVGGWTAHCAFERWKVGGLGPTHRACQVTPSGRPEPWTCQREPRREGQEASRLEGGSGGSRRRGSGESAPSSGTWPNHSGRGGLGVAGVLQGRPDGRRRHFPHYALDARLGERAVARRNGGVPTSAGDGAVRRFWEVGEAAPGNLAVAQGERGSVGGTSPPTPHSTSFVRRSGETASLPRVWARCRALEALLSAWHGFSQAAWDATAGLGAAADPRCGLPALPVVLP